MRAIVIALGTVYLWCFCSSAAGSSFLEGTGGMCAQRAWFMQPLAPRRGRKRLAQKGPAAPLPRMHNRSGPAAQARIMRAQRLPLLREGVPRHGDARNGKRALLDESNLFVGKRTVQDDKKWKCRPLPCHSAFPWRCESEKGAADSSRFLARGAPSPAAEPFDKTSKPNSFLHHQKV